MSHDATTTTTTTTTTAAAARTRLQSTLSPAAAGAIASVDLSAFSEAQFDAKQWLNSILSSNTSSNEPAVPASVTSAAVSTTNDTDASLAQLSAKATSILKQLQFLSQDAQLKHDRIRRSLLAPANMSRLETDMSSITLSAAAVSKTIVEASKTLAANTIDDIDQPETSESNGNVLRQAARLETARANVHQARDAVAHMRKWRQIEGDVGRFIRDGRYEDALSIIRDTRVELSSQRLTLVAAHIEDSQQKQKQEEEQLADITASNAGTRLRKMSSMPAATIAAINGIEDRLKLLNKLTSDVLTAIAPQLRQDLEARAPEACNRWLDIYRSAGHVDMFRIEYLTVRETQLLNEWRDQAFEGLGEKQWEQLAAYETDGKRIVTPLTRFSVVKNATSAGSASSNEAVGEAMVAFLGQVERFIVNEAKWYASVVGDMEDEDGDGAELEMTIRELLKRIIKPVANSLGDVLTRTVATTGLQSMPLIVATHRAAEALAVAATRTLEMFASASHRGSQSTLAPIEDMEWLRILFEPLSEYQHDLPAYERHLVTPLVRGFSASVHASVDSLVSDDGSFESSVARANALLDCAVLQGNKILEVLANGMERMFTFSFGFTWLGFAAVFDEATAGMFDELCSVMDAVRFLCEIPAAYRLLCDPTSLDGEFIGSAGVDSTTTSDDDDDSNVPTISRTMDQDAALCRVAARALDTVRMLATKVRLMLAHAFRRLEPLDVAFQSRSAVPMMSLGIQLLMSSKLSTPELASNIHRLLSESSPSSAVINTLPRATPAVLRAVTAGKWMIADTLLLEVIPPASCIHSLKQWSQPEPPKTAIVSGVELTLPQFSLAQSAAIRRIGSAMLSLPERFDMLWAAARTISQGNTPRSPNVLSLFLSQLAALTTVRPTADAASSQLSSALSVLDQLDPDFDQDDRTAKDDAIAHWIFTLGNTVQSVIVRQIVIGIDIEQRQRQRQPHGNEVGENAGRGLSEYGLRRLKVDLSYLGDIISAINLEPTEEMDALALVIGMETSEERQSLLAGDDGGDDDDAEVEDDHSASQDVSGFLDDKFIARRMINLIQGY